MRKNIILITIDCLRADHLEHYGYNRETTPFLNSLREKIILFKNAFTNGPFTPAAFPAILTSTYPLKNGKYITLKNRIFVSEILQKAGIETAAIHSNPYLSNYAGYNRGFDYFEDFMDLSKCKKIERIGGLKSKLRALAGKLINRVQFLKAVKERIMPPKSKKKPPKTPKTPSLKFAPAEIITKYAINWFNARDREPFFLWLHYMDLHEPYFIGDININQKYSKDLSRSQVIEIKKENTKDIINLYDDKLRYIDSNIERLYNHLKNKNILEDTIIVFTSDHGDQFFEHGGFTHRANYYEELIHIPLLIYGHQFREREVEKLVCHLDIAPTILSFYDIDSPTGYRGFNLLSAHERKFIICESSHNERGVYIAGHKIYPPEFMSFCYRTQEWKYIFYSSRPNELYNLKEDPHERNNVINKHPQVVKNIEKTLNERLEANKFKRKYMKESKKISKEIDDAINTLKGL